MIEATSGAWAAIIAGMEVREETAELERLASEASQMALALDGRELYRDFWHLRADVAELHRALAYSLSRLGAENHRVLARLHSSYRVASGALVAQVILWVGHLAL